MSKRERHIRYCLSNIVLIFLTVLLCLSADAILIPQNNTQPPSMPLSNLNNQQSLKIPELVKTKPYPVIEILRDALGFGGNIISDSDILNVEVIPIGNAKGFAYFDGKTTWKYRYNLLTASDFDNDPETNCWKIIGGMSEEEKEAELDLLDEGGAGLGASGTGEIDIRVFHKTNAGKIDIIVFRAKIVLKKLIIEVDWMEGSTTRTVAKGYIRQITFKPVINQDFINAFGQAGIEVVIADTPEKGNKHNIIPRDALFVSNFPINRENLSELLPQKYRGWRRDVKIFNEGISYIAKGIISKGYMDFDASRHDVIYVIGAQRWASLPGDEIQQTRGATAIFERNGKWHNVVFIFNLSIAESTGAVNKSQEIQIPYEVASVHTVLHECAAHCFPLRWSNIETGMANDDYWNKWRYLFVGHCKRNENHEYGRIYRTCVTSSESTLDAAYYTWLGEPRLTDFSNQIGNSVIYKSRDIIRDYIIECKPKNYGRLLYDNRVVTKQDNSPASLSHH